MVHFTVANHAWASYHTSVNSPSDLFDHHADYQPDDSLEGLLKSTPAKWVVYLFTDAADNPVQLLCVKNLRASLKRRLGGEEIMGPTRKVDYRDLVRRVYWRRVDSAFEADLAYLEIARDIFPKSYRGMLGFDPAWFVHVNPADDFPRYVKTIDPTRPGQAIGPFADKHAAARFFQLVEDAFDLCRYYNILIEAPDGRACAYKEMGKCPAPCDGSISMEQYRELIKWSAATVVSPEGFVAEHTARMNAAASELNFEAAARIKQFVEQIGQFGHGAFRFAKRLEDFQFLSLQHGPRRGTAKIFLVMQGMIEQVGCVIDELRVPSDFLRHILSRAARTRTEMTEQAVERMGIVTDHLFRARRSSGVFLPICDLEERSFSKAYKELQKQNTPDDSEEEGVIKELQQL